MEVLKPSAEEILRADMADLAEKQKALGESLAANAESEKVNEAKIAERLAMASEMEASEKVGLEKRDRVTALAGWHPFPESVPRIPRDLTEKQLCFVRRRQKYSEVSTLALASFQRVNVSVPGVVGVSFQFCDFRTGEPFSNVEAYRLIPDTWIN
jgi:hypothetical protein